MRRVPRRSRNRFTPHPPTVAVRHQPKSPSKCRLNDRLNCVEGARRSPSTWYRCSARNAGSCDSPIRLGCCYRSTIAGFGAPGSLFSRYSFARPILARSLATSRVPNPVRAITWGNWTRDARGGDIVNEVLVGVGRDCELRSRRAGQAGSPNIPSAQQRQRALSVPRGGSQEDTGSYGHRFVWREGAEPADINVVPGHGSNKSLVRMDPRHLIMPPDTNAVPASSAAGFGSAAKLAGGSCRDEVVMALGTLRIFC